MGRQYTFNPNGADDALGSPGQYNQGYGSSTAANAARHLSDGTLVFMYYDTTNGWVLAYTKNRTSPSTIATHVENAFNNLAGVNNTNVSLGLAFSLAVDASDNIYVTAVFGFTTLQNPNVVFQIGVGVVAFAKGSGLVWTQQTGSGGAVASSNNGNAAVIGASAEWAPTGGGTNGAGHVAFAFSYTTGSPSTNTGWALETFDAGAALTGAAAPVARSTLLTTTAQYAAPIDLAPQALPGKFATTGLVLLGYATGIGGPGVYYAQSYAVSSAGAVTLGSQYQIAAGPGGAGTPAGLCRITYIGNNAWAALVESAALAPQIARLSTSAVLTTPTTYGAVANFPTTVPNASAGANTVQETSHSLDIAYDSGSGKIWLFGWH